jgi:hypothetical protein
MMPFTELRDDFHHYFWSIRNWLTFSLGHNYPNPVKWKTTIPFQINQPGQVYIEVINTHDMVIDVLENRYMEAGRIMVYH